MSNSHIDILLAGGFAAFTVDLLVYPLDTLKTRFQSPDYNKIYYDASKRAINRRLLFRGLYQGVGGIILVTIPSSGAFFTTYEAVKRGLTKANIGLSSSSSPLIPQPLIHSAASSTAELVSCFILTPAEVLKQNAQMARKSTVSSTSRGSTGLHSSVTLQTLKRFKRPSQLWRGYSALVARNLPYTALQFPMFEHMRAVIKQYRKEHKTFTGSLTETGIITAISAGSAGSIAAIATTPVDVVKTRIMLSAAGDSSERNPNGAAGSSPKHNQSLSKLASKESTSKKGGLSMAKEILNTHGIKGLFRGAILRAAWTALGSGLYLGVYESGREWLESPHGDTREDEE